MLANGGLDTDAEYNYTQISIPCDTIKAKRVAAKIENYVLVPPYNESQLAAAVAQQPVSVGIDAEASFQFYSSGILPADSVCVGGDPASLDHAVLVVGFGTSDPLSNSTDYWLVKNSWGPGWGESGYIRMARNVTDQFGQDGGLCGIAVK